MTGGLPWLDWALLAALALSVIVGLLRGLVFELMSLAGWLVAYFVSLWYAPQLAPHIPVGMPGSALNHAAALVLVFVGTLIAWNLLARLVRMAISKTPLTVPDRILGAAFGLIRGFVLLLVMATVVALTPAAQSAAWQASSGAGLLSAAVHGIKPLLPDSVTRWLPG